MKTEEPIMSPAARLAELPQDPMDHVIGWRSGLPDGERHTLQSRLDQLTLLAKGVPDAVAKARRRYIQIAGKRLIQLDKLAQGGGQSRATSSLKASLEFQREHLAKLETQVERTRADIKEKEQKLEAAEKGENVRHVQVMKVMDMEVNAELTTLVDAMDLVIDDIEDSQS